MTMEAFRDLAPLMNPRSVAVVGASERHGSAGRLVLENLRSLSYVGQVYAVHPKYEKVMGFACYPDLQSIPGPVDSVAVMVGAGKALDVLEESVGIGARAAWVLASGFAESGPEGKERQAELVRFARETGLLVCGPNCIGVANLIDRTATYSVALSPRARAGEVSAVVQSGAVCLGLANAARFGFRYVVSSGNEAVLDSAEYINYFAKDSKTRVIVAFLEGITRPRRFAEAARVAAEQGKPILLVKVGRSEVARRTVQAHTGALAGSDEAIGALFRRLGVVRLDTLNELMEAAELFCSGPLPQGSGVALLTLSGGQIGLVADLAEKLGLEFAPLAESTRQGLAQVLPPYSPIANPLDAWGSGDLVKSYPASMEVVSRDENVDLLAVSRDTPSDVAPREVEQSLAIAEASVVARKGSGKPVLVFSNFSAGFHPEVHAVLRNGGVPYLQGTWETLRAIKALMDYNDFQQRKSQSAKVGCPSPDDLPDLRAKLAAARGALSETQVRELLSSYGIFGPNGAVAASERQAVEQAERLGYPVVLKIVSPDIQHKTESNAVRLGVRDALEVAAAYHSVTEAARLRNPGARLEGVLVQEMVQAGAVEVIAGIIRDPDVGPLLVYGSGGIYVEVMKDSTLRIPPVSNAEALAMIGETRGARLLRGFRGQPVADVDALADALVRLSQLAVDLGDQISALEINPLMVLPHGEGVRAADALLELAD